jgi:C4-dicarboxylate transporter DctQ subunit
MQRRLRGTIEWIRRRAENLCVAMLALMFIAFIIQIVFRYVFNFPVGWTSEISVIAWLYIVLLGSAFWLKEGEEIRFDLITAQVGPRTGRVIGFVVAVAAAVIFAVSLPATWKYVSFMKVESTSYLKIRLDLLYAVYVIFALAVVVRYAWAAWRHLRGHDAASDVDLADRGYGL